VVEYGATVERANTRKAGEPRCSYPGAAQGSGLDDWIADKARDKPKSPTVGARPA
jgi:hypothetical protein